MLNISDEEKQALLNQHSRPYDGYQTLRSLGPKSWKAAYVQPSRRPTDGRYGDNPNRLQHYYQIMIHSNSS